MQPDKNHRFEVKNTFTGEFQNMLERRTRWWLL